MSLGLMHWKGRRKNMMRCRAHDMRLFSPFLGVGLCVLSSATLIFAAERLGPDQIETQQQTALVREAAPQKAFKSAYLTISSSSTSNASAAAAGIRPVPRLP